MSDTVNSSDPEALLGAMQRRLDEIDREEAAEWQAFANDPANVDPPQVSTARDVERTEILAAMDQQRQVIEDRETKKKKWAKKGGKGGSKPDPNVDNKGKDDEDDDDNTEALLQQVYRPIASK